MYKVLVRCILFVIVGFGFWIWRFGYMLVNLLAGVLLFVVLGFVDCVVCLMWLLCEFVCTIWWLMLCLFAWWYCCYSLVIVLLVY